MYNLLILELQYLNLEPRDAPLRLLFMSWKTLCNTQRALLKHINYTASHGFGALCRSGQSYLCFMGNTDVNFVLLVKCIYDPGWHVASLICALFLCQLRLLQRHYWSFDYGFDRGRDGPIEWGPMGGRHPATSSPFPCLFSGL